MQLCRSSSRLLTLRKKVVYDGRNHLRLVRGISASLQCTESQNFDFWKKMVGAREYLSCRLVTYRVTFEEWHLHVVHASMKHVWSHLHGVHLPTTYAIHAIQIEPDVLKIVPHLHRLTKLWAALNVHSRHRVFRGHAYLTVIIIYVERGLSMWM